MWSKVRQLIERLDVRGEPSQFAQEAEWLFDVVLEQMWAESEDGGELLWLAASVGANCHQMVGAAHALLEDVIRQTPFVGPLERRCGRQMVQVLKQVQKWNRGKQSAEQIEQAGLLLSRLCEDAAMGASPWSEEDAPFSEVLDHLAQAVIWLTTLVGECLSLRLSDEQREGRVWWVLADQAAQASALHKVGGDEEQVPESYHRAYALAMQRFAHIVREHITRAQVQEAAQTLGVWPLP
jgi:hypothetical protein